MNTFQKPRDANIKIMSCNYFLEFNHRVKDVLISTLWRKTLLYDHVRLWSYLSVARNINSTRIFVVQAAIQAPVLNGDRF